MRLRSYRAMLKGRPRRSHSELSTVESHGGIKQDSDTTRAFWKAHLGVVVAMVEGRLQAAFGGRRPVRKEVQEREGVAGPGSGGRVRG